MTDFKLFAAPLQGYTDAPWRKWHADIFGGADLYFTPFIRFERGEARARDMRDLTSPLTDPETTIPQIIFRDMTEMRALIEAVSAAGYRRVDLNMGCPFPPQVHKGRGAGLLSHPDVVAEAMEVVKSTPDIKFSVKMRLGDTDAGQWRDIMPLLSQAPLSHITLHARIALQQYRGTPDMESAAEFISTAPHKAIYNGDVASPEDIGRLRSMFPDIAGVMVGRGLLARPSLFAEYVSGHPVTPARQIADMVALHAKMHEHYADTLCGDSQLLSKLRPFWDYAEPLIGHRAAKAIHKAGSLRAYLAAVADIQFNIQS